MDLGYDCKCKKKNSSIKNYEFYFDWWPINFKMLP